MFLHIVASGWYFIIIVGIGHLKLTFIGGYGRLVGMLAGMLVGLLVGMSVGILVGILVGIVLH